MRDVFASPGQAEHDLYRVNRQSDRFSRSVKSSFSAFVVKVSFRVVTHVLGDDLPLTVRHIVASRASFGDLSTKL